MTKEKTKEIELKSLRVNVKKSTHDGIEIIQAEQRILGMSMTQAETIDYIVANFNNKK